MVNDGLTSHEQGILMANTRIVNHGTISIHIPSTTFWRHVRCCIQKKNHLVVQPGGSGWFNSVVLGRIPYCTAVSVLAFPLRLLERRHYRLSMTIRSSKWVLGSFQTTAYYTTSAVLQQEPNKNHLRHHLRESDHQYYHFQEACQHLKNAKIGSNMFNYQNLHFCIPNTNFLLINFACLPALKLNSWPFFSPLFWNPPGCLCWIPSFAEKALLVSPQVSTTPHPPTACRLCMPRCVKFSPWLHKSIATFGCRLLYKAIQSGEVQFLLPVKSLFSTAY